MNQGGGTLVLKGSERWHGAGHNAVIGMEGEDYLVFHAYDATDKGRPKLQRLPIQWVAGWPAVTVANR